jgi:hypothetical protein
MENNNLIFFNKDTRLDYGKTIDFNTYQTGPLHIAIGRELSYYEKIKPVLARTIYREDLFDFISIVQMDYPNKITGALILGEPARSSIVKVIFTQLKKHIKLHYKTGVISAEDGFEVYDKPFSKYYWSKDIIGKENVYDWNGGRPKLKPLLE